MGITFGALASCIACTMTIRTIYIRRKAQHDMFAYHIGAVEGMDLAEKAGELRKLVSAGTLDGKQEDPCRDREDHVAERLLPRPQQNPEEDWSLPYYARNTYAMNILDYDQTSFEDAQAEDLDDEDENATKPNAPSELRPKSDARDAGDGDESSACDRPAFNANASKGKLGAKGGDIIELGASADLDARGGDSAGSPHANDAQDASAPLSDGESESLDDSDADGSRKGKGRPHDHEGMDDSESEDTRERGRSRSREGRAEGEISMSSLRSAVRSLAEKVDSLSNSNDTPTSTSRQSITRRKVRARLISHLAKDRSLSYVTRDKGVGWVVSRTKIKSNAVREGARLSVTRG